MYEIWILINVDGSHLSGMFFLSTVKWLNAVSQLSLFSNASLFCCVCVIYSVCLTSATFVFSTYPSFVESALWAICFSLFHALCLIHPLIIYLQIENDIKESMKTEMAQLQQSAVHNHTAAMLEMGTNLLSKTAEQTRKLTDVETQVIYPSQPYRTPIGIHLMHHWLSYSTLNHPKKATGELAKENMDDALFMWYSKHTVCMFKFSTSLDIWGSFRRKRTRVALVGVDFCWCVKKRKVH